MGEFALGLTEIVNQHLFLGGPLKAWARPIFCSIATSAAEQLPGREGLDGEKQEGEKGGQKVSVWKAAGQAEQRALG